jgi:hypothetical protein
MESGDLEVSEKRKTAKGEDQDDEFFGDIDDVLPSVVESQERNQISELVESDRPFA